MRAAYGACRFHVLLAGVGEEAYEGDLVYNAK